MGGDQVNDGEPIPHAVQLNYARPVAPSPLLRPSKNRGPSVFTVTVAAFGATIINFFLAVNFGSLAAGEIFVFSMLPVGLCVLIALVIAILTPPKSRYGVWALAILCLLPALIIAAIFIADDIAFRRNGPFDRFRDHLAKVIPASVSGLAFVPYAERQGETALMLRFSIAPADLDRILANDGFVRVQPGKLHNVNDTFNNAAYLAIGNADEFYQRTDALDEVGTLRVNKEHTAVVFRNETDVRNQKTIMPRVAAPLPSATAPTTTPAPSVLRLPTANRTQ
jgi:hypothetical protein